jgi:hypothetical protein
MRAMLFLKTYTSNEIRYSAIMTNTMSFIFRQKEIQGAI